MDSKQVTSNMTSPGEEPLTHGEDPKVVSSKGRMLSRPDYKKLAGMEDDLVSRKSQKSHRTSKTNKTKSSQGRRSRKKSEVGERYEEDSRAGDFDDEDEVLSLGSDASRLKKLQKDLEMNSVTFGENYNEYKVQQGLQVLLEDTELPTNLEQEEIFDGCKAEHHQQLTATRYREVRARRTLEILEMREEILMARERTKKLEWEAQLHTKKSEIQRNQWYLDQKKQKLEMVKLLEQEREQAAEFQMINTREKIPTATVSVAPGVKPHDLNFVTVDPNPLGNPVIVDSAPAIVDSALAIADSALAPGDATIVHGRVADWVSSHSQHNALHA